MDTEKRAKLIAIAIFIVFYLCDLAVVGLILHSKRYGYDCNLSGCTAPQNNN